MTLKCKKKKKRVQVNPTLVSSGSAAAAPTCHDCRVVLTGLEGALALPALHLHSSVRSFLQGEGGEVLRDREQRTKLDLCKANAESLKK